MFEEQGPDACLCPRNIAAIRDARLKQLIRKHRVDRPAPACLPDDLREDWNDKEALKAGPRGCVLCKAGPRECPLLSAPVGHVDTPSGLHQAEPAAGHQAVPAAPQAASPPPVQAASPSIAGTDAGRPGHDAPIWVDVNPNTAYPGTLDVADVRLAGPPPAPGDLAAAPSGAADAAGSVEFLNLDDGRAGAGTDAGRPGHDAILDGMQALRFETATKDDMAALTTAMETGFDEMSKRLDDMEEKVQSLQHGWAVAAEGAAEDHEGEASGPVSAPSMDADGWRARYANKGEASEAQ